METLINGDCLVEMDKMDDEIIDLTVTSPPYDNLRTYNGNISQWNEDKWKLIIKQLYRITNNGGVVVWVVGDATIKGSETGTSFKQALWAMDCGFRLHDTMIYLKTGFNNPSANRYHQVFEYMFVFVKGKLKTFNPIKDRENKYKKRGGKSIRQRNGETVKGFGGQFLSQFGQRYNVWLLNHYGIAEKKHPATFPEKLANDHIISWSNEDDTVFDPFLGSGTTGKMAVLNNRKFIGIELDKQYFEIAKERISKAKADIDNSFFGGE